METGQVERVEVRVTGRVQGVGFRAFTQREAHRRGVTGWVRNERDGSVRAVAEGPRDVLEAFVEALERGPSAARVERVVPQWSATEGEFDDFSVRYF